MGCYARVNPYNLKCESESESERESKSVHVLHGTPNSISTSLPLQSRDMIREKSREQIERESGTFTFSVFSVLYFLLSTFSRTWK